MYKIISDNKVIDAVFYPNFIRFLQHGHIAMTDKTTAQGIVGSDDETIYSFVPGTKYPVVTLVEICAEEFKRLKNLLNSNQEVCADEAALAKAKRAKISSMSGVCKNKITAGFSIELSDNKTYHFKLTTEDQLNLMQIENQLAFGETSFVYHATNQPCKIFNKDDMYKVVRAFRKHVLYHTTYFNAVKQYIETLTDIEKVNLFSYGMDVSECIEDKLLIQLLKNGGA